MSLDTTTISLSILGAFIGTYGGAYLINFRQEQKIKSVRKIAKKAINIFQKYNVSDKTYVSAASQFNNEINTTQKRAVLVALHKLGIPVIVPVNTAFKIKKIQFANKLIDGVELKDMISQIDSGNCDHLFYLDPDNYFNEDLKIRTIRNIAQKFVNDVFKKSIYKPNDKLIIYPENWIDQFTIGETNVLLVFLYKIRENYYFDINTGQVNLEKVDALLQEIEIGIWDTYLQWDFTAFENMNAQKKSAETLERLFNPPINNNIAPNTQAENLTK